MKSKLNPPFRALDLAHSALICVANWFYLVENFANTDAPKQITWYVVPSLFPHIYRVSVGLWM